MRTDQAIQHFGTKSALAKALRIRTPSIYSWGELVPLGRAYELQDLTAGALKVDRALYDKDRKAA
jgi:hypothetical protein